jgi:hypothetical protein
MAELVLGPLLRYVSDTCATIWVETDASCTVEICGRQTTTFLVHSHHFALVVLEDLAPGSSTPYEVHLDGDRRWPLPGSTFPESLIRTHGGAGPVRIAFGSCRASAPHKPPFTLRLDDHPEGRGVDALRALGVEMLQQSPDEWPHVLLFLGDQVYADESSPSTAARIERRRAAGDGPVHPPDRVVANFEEYSWLYHETWTPDVERWVLSTVPSTMIFDDHDMIDDWNISRAWVDDIRAEPWWSEHIIGGLVSYWTYQHLGNLSPERLRDEGMLDACLRLGDATDFLRRWALSSEEFTPVPGGYQFSFDRHVGDVHVVVMDVRNGRVLEPGGRRMIDPGEWAWVRSRVLEPARHVIVASSLPVFVPGGLHGIQQWNEAMCDGAWGPRMARLSERLRRALDLEGWPAFDHSLRELEELLIEASTATDDHSTPATITIVGGDIHFGFIADVGMPVGCEGTVRQVVCSPLRNILRTRERRVMRFGASRWGQRIGRWLQRTVHRGATNLTWSLSGERVFDNNIGSFAFDGDDCAIVIRSALLDDAGTEALRPMVATREPVAQRSSESVPASFAS